MVKELVCYVSPVILNWGVYDREQVQHYGFVDSENFEAEALAMCEEAGAKTFRLLGNQAYCEGLAEALNRTQFAKYSNYKINVEVN